MIVGTCFSHISSLHRGSDKFVSTRRPPGVARVSTVARETLIGRHWDQCPVCKKSRGLERYSGPFYFPVARYQFPLPADVPEKCKFLS